MMENNRNNQSGFSLIELLVAATVFTFVVSGVSGLFVNALDLQRRATGIQKIEENVQFVLESIAREVRVSQITSGDTACDPLDPLGTSTLVMEHPVNGTVTYEYEIQGDVGVIFRNDQQITSADVNVVKFAFCVSGSGDDDLQTRITMPLTVESLAGRPSTRVRVSLQSTVVSRDLSSDFTP
jgi:prepilin-type N-terminal cleavage/methylation domain-containing protein